MNELVNIKKAFEKRLATITPSIHTAYEGVSFEPVEGQPYQRVQLVPSNPENPTLGDGYYREVGQFQVFLFYPTNEGTLAAITRAELIRSYFQRGTTLTEGGTDINILVTPYISGANIIGNRIIVSVLISYSVGVM